MQIARDPGIFEEIVGCVLRRSVHWYCTRICQVFVEELEGVYWTHHLGSEIVHLKTFLE